MVHASYITTSWDDGHPLSLRVADLLEKHGIKGTFYIPRAYLPSMLGPNQIRSLSRDFEVGSHTMDHVNLLRVSDRKARAQIVDSKAWLEDVTGKPCAAFCPPWGSCSTRHLHMIHDAGYRSLRTIELLSLAQPRLQAGLFVMPTTVEACAHTLRTYLRSMMAAGRFESLCLFVCHGRSMDWCELARRLMRAATIHGGVFHLWGHPHELQQAGQWRRLEEVFRFLGELTRQARTLTNSQVCQCLGARSRSCATEIGDGSFNRDVCWHACDS